MENKRFNQGEFASDNFVRKYAELLSTRGFLPHIDEQDPPKASVIRRMLELREEVIRRGKKEPVPHSWENPIFYQAQVDLKEGIVVSVGISEDMRYGYYPPPRMASSDRVGKIAVAAAEENARRRRELGLTPEAYIPSAEALNRQTNR